ncbi:MAG: phenylalanine--tRNA ligase subunit beta [Planctomycetes bacterium]|nr:phenylalanine--tRNA ligase subunit beta [Planctomycetota bacterium]
MLVSLNWIRDYVDLPPGLDPRELAGQFTVTTAEVDDVRPAEGVVHGDPAAPDWVIEIDNKSITNRPDLWGHYGVAREVAAILGLPLRPYEHFLAPLEELARGDLPEVPIVIADGDACPRYTGLIVGSVPWRVSAPWMQARLSAVGLRPIGALVDLTNYVMADLGQPMHAFDATRVDRIEVDWAREGEPFRTLDGVERRLTRESLMIQCRGRSVALAGVMGGQESEVSTSTNTLLLESANFHPWVVRRTATRLSLRTDASARFEKSQDPANTVLGIRRFVRLARELYPDLSLRTRLSDCYPRRKAAPSVVVKPRHVARTIGRAVSVAEATALLEPLGFSVAERDGDWLVGVPSFRGTGDVSIEADVIEEIARRIGYGNIAPAMPAVTVRRFEPHALHELEQRTIEYFTATEGFHEVHGYLWNDAIWLRQLGSAPGGCVTLKNPAAEGLQHLRRRLMPGLLAATTRNRFYFASFSLLELGSVFERSGDGDAEYRHLGLVMARRGKREEQELFQQLKGGLEGWAWDRFARAVTFRAAAAASDRPWEHPRCLAEVRIDGAAMHGAVGTVGVVDGSLRRAMDEHLAAWSIAWAELRLDGLATLERRVERLAPIPPFPRVELDFSFLVPAATRYAEVVRELAAFRHPLLKEVRYVGAYQGGAVPADRRSLTCRVVIGDDARTLIEDDALAVRRAFEEHVERHGFTIRR